MGDDMKDMGIPSFMMTDLMPNQNDMMDMDLLPNINDPNPINTHNVKRENNTGILPPEITSNHNYNPPPSSNHIYPSNLANFSMSASPPQQSPMFMDQINPNSSVYPQQSDFAYGTNNNNNNSMMRSRSLQSGPATLRPANLPSLRRSASATSQNNNNTNNSSSIQYLGKPSKGNNNNNNISHSMNSNNNNNNTSSHVLTPFDYPLSNPTINTHSDSSGSAGFNDGYNPQNAHFNFLWWYPEIKFCELDPAVVPLP